MVLPESPSTEHAMRVWSGTGIGYGMLSAVQSKRTLIVVLLVSYWDSVWCYLRVLSGPAYGAMRMMRPESSSAEPPPPPPPPRLTRTPAHAIPYLSTALSVGAYASLVMHRA
eukprot:1839967-Rhodomonas_salina.1